MTVILEQHSFKYELEATLKLFIPAEHFQFLSERVPVEGDFLATKLERRNDALIASAELYYQGVSASREQILPLDIAPEQQEYALCFLAFSLLSHATGICPKWGMLTGVRPIRRIFARMEQGSSLEEALLAMKQQDLVSSEKVELAGRIAAVQLPMLRALHSNRVSLYISIPFCPTRCTYCSFVSHSMDTARKLVPDYLSCLIRELEALAKIMQEQALELDTVYVGGGTPTALDAKQLDQLFRAVQSSFDLSELREYTVEAGRPDTITREKLEVLKQYGVSRISINPQTCNDTVLEAIGRCHTNRQTMEAFSLAREAGFSNINMDLIAGLPKDTEQSFSQTLDQILALSPESITVHCLTLKRAADLYSGGAANLAVPADAMVSESAVRLPDAGYRPYYLYRQKNSVSNLENTGYAKPGFESLYNILIMDETQTILGAGCGASTKLVGQGKLRRIHNFKFPYEYIGAFDKILEKKADISRLLRVLQSQNGGAAL